MHRCGNPKMRKVNHLLLVVLIGLFYVCWKENQTSYLSRLISPIFARMKAIPLAIFAPQMPHYWPRLELQIRKNNAGKRGVKLKNYKTGERRQPHL
jgi:hypothetical protein